MFVLSLLYSDAVFCQIFPRECTETFQEGHRRAFEFFGGVPKRITYDNTKIAVSKVIQKRGGVFTREFLRLESHYLFGHHFRLVRQANEKGHIESLVGYCRRNFLVPVPKFDDFEAFNEGLTNACRRELERKLRGKPATKAELLEEDRQVMLPLPPQPLESRRVETCRSNSLSLVRFDRNDYSVPTAYAHHAVTAIGGIERVRFVVQDRVVAEHLPCFKTVRKTATNQKHASDMPESMCGGGSICSMVRRSPCQTHQRTNGPTRKSTIRSRVRAFQ